jgi:hypothetical protein
MMQVLVFLTPLTRLTPSMQRLSVFMSDAIDAERRSCVVRHRA